MGRTILSAMLGLFLGVAAVHGEDVVTEPILTFTGHTDAVYSVAYSPDGTKVLTGGPIDYLARLWDAATGTQIRVFSGHTKNVHSVAFSPDGTKVLTGSGEKTARLWDAATGEQIRTFIGHIGGLSSVAYSPDGTKVLTGSGDGTARLWDAATGEQIRTFSGHPNGVKSVAYSPDGTKVLTGGDGKGWLWDASTGALIRTFSGHAGGVECVAFSPERTKVLTGSVDKTAKLWDAATGACIRTFTGHSAPVRSVAFSPDGTIVLTGSVDTTARLWDAATGLGIRTFSGHTGYVFSVAFSPDGTTVLTGSIDTTARLWDAGPALVIRSAPITGVSIAGDATGVTPFWQYYDQPGQSGTLSAPSVALNSSVRYDFVRWEIDGEQQPQGQTSVEFTVDASTMATAVYELRTHTLTVVSQALAGLDIMGDDPGNTPYCATRTDQEAVHLALDEPLSIVSDDQLYNFVYWMIDGVPQPRGGTSVDIVMDADRTATAVYNMFADANGDCVVNVLDLIFVRNRLGERPYTGDNWRADITCDMVINVLDLIAVRNYLGTRCSE